MGHAFKNQELYILLLNHPETGQSFNVEKMQREYKIAGITIATMDQECIESETKENLKFITDFLWETIINEFM